MAAEHLAAHGDDATKSLTALDLNCATQQGADGAGGPVLEDTVVHNASETVPNRSKHAGTQIRSSC
jgi:hypothetical protein